MHKNKEAFSLIRHISKGTLTMECKFSSHASCRAAQDRTYKGETGRYVRYDCRQCDWLFSLIKLNIYQNQMLQSGHLARYELLIQWCYHCSTQYRISSFNHCLQMPLPALEHFCNGKSCAIKEDWLWETYGTKGGKHTSRYLWLGF